MSCVVIEDSIEVVSINKEFEVISELSGVEIEGIERFVELESEGLPVDIKLWSTVGCIESGSVLIVEFGRGVSDNLSEVIEGVVIEISEFFSAYEHSFLIGNKDGLSLFDGEGVVGVI